MRKLAFLVVFLAFASRPGVAQTPPNVVLIVADDLGAMDLGCYGSKFHRTPNLDQLASDGMRFTQSYAACPVCSPSRAALQTGRYPERFQLTDWLPGRGNRSTQRLASAELRQHLPLAEVTLAEALSAAGYVCAHIGKWHLGGKGFEPTRQGYAVNVAGTAMGSPRSYFAPFLHNDGKPLPGLREASEGEYLTDRLTSEAERFLTSQRDRPFFLHLAHFAPHTPLQAKPSIEKTYPPPGPVSGKQNNPVYAAMLTSLDESVGRIVHKLAELGLSERTIVIFTSDNGGLCTTEGPHTPATSNAPLREGKGWLYEGGLRTPLLVAWPGTIARKSVCDVPVCGIDLLPTLQQACGAVPDKDHACDGTSLLEVWKDSGTLTREELYWHYPHYSNQGGRPGGAVRSGPWKLVDFYEEGRKELYHLGDDPSESRNLAASEPKRVGELAEKLAQWRKTVGARMPEQNPQYEPNPQDERGEIVLPARSADVRGEMLRFEPQPHKNTLGYWVSVTDWARFEFTVKQPGRFALEALVGCGKGSGGSKVRFEILASGASEPATVLLLTVPETGGFQSFVPLALDEVVLPKGGRYEVRVRAVEKPGPAVMDLRQLRFTPRR